ncbi:RNA-guided endonuclease InsQ/TnpB family protein [Telluria beijingensis]|uniref:RNA-guided endonuclease InsQ/TnpB family protein n=1 Tax=Telluria beijingensis TaxID=3068633 RepID=UPI00279526E5|nr:transposase [Massilia sp. REN29]
MMLAHRIRLEATPEQSDYFARAAGTARKVWNWALAEWHRQVELGQRPQAKALKKAFNAIKYVHPDWLDEQGNPWLKTIHRDAHSQPFMHLERALSHYFKQRQAGERAFPPVFKKKGRCRDSFYIANDKVRLEGKYAVLPKIGKVALVESLRLTGKIMGAYVLREADHWYLAVQIDLPEQESILQRSGDGVIGVDLGISAAAVLSSGEKISAPRPLRKSKRRLRIRSRRHTRKLKAEKKAAGIVGAIPKGARLPVSCNRKKSARALARTHARIAHVRADFTHKLTTRLCRENQAVAIEDLNMRGMLANHRLARAIADVGFDEIRRQLQYKAQRYRTLLVVADRWYPSSKLCSACGAHYAALKLGEREWSCQCGARHDRDVNAAINLERLATDALVAITALPVASLTVTSGTAANILLAGGGKVTPVRYEYGQQDGSGQEEDAEHICSRL